MNGRYTGDYQGYINRNADFVEYRFEPVEDERYFRSVHIFARQKHVIVRFSGLPKLKKTGPGLSKTLKNAHGNDYYALEFSAPIDGGLDELEKFLGKTVSFSRAGAHGLGRQPKNSAKLTPGDSVGDAEQDAAEELAEPISSEEDGRVRELKAVFLRRGQKAFRNALLKAYERGCAVTGCIVEDVLEAAHIIPYKGNETDRCDNGLLLRADIHTLFDLGLLWINEEMKVRIADALHSTEYGKLQGRKIRMPKAASLRPHPDHLAHHAEISRKLRAAGRSQ